MADGLADKRAAAPTAAPADIAARNAAALEKRRAAIAAAKAAEVAKVLPAGWRKVESRSRPGEFVYENIHTEERQAWFPDAPAVEEAVAAAPLVAVSEEQAKKDSIKEKNRLALLKRKEAQVAQMQVDKQVPLPDGWIRSESRSRPGEVVYENTVTGERQAWFPDAPAVQPTGPIDPKKAELQAKNKAALDARKQQAAALKNSEDNKKTLPDGWKRVESRSRPGEFVYENMFTEERQAWFPEGPAEKPLPKGWRKVESRSYPGEFVYENMHTLERQAWLPSVAAPTVEGMAVEPPQAQASAKAGAPVAAGANVKMGRPVVGKCKALYDYTANNTEEEIDLIEGDIILIEYRAKNGWWVGMNSRTNRSGIFPGSYVEDVK